MIRLHNCIRIGYKWQDSIAVAAACENNILRWSPLTDLFVLQLVKFLRVLQIRQRRSAVLYWLTRPTLCGLWSSYFSIDLHIC